MEDFSCLRLYGFQGKPSLFPFYVSNKIFTIEVCIQYKYCVHLFNKKRKNQYNSFPWKIGDISMNNISHLDEFTTQFDHFNLHEIHTIKGFDPKGLFPSHMFSIGYGSSFNMIV
jgi:hypothetical protein